MKIRTCPQCGSTDIRLHMGGITGVKYKCSTCGYTGELILETEDRKRFG